MDFRPTVQLTEDGSATLRDPSHGDTYHSCRGAVGESRYIFIERGFDAVAADTVRILEAGLGTGLNAWLTLKQAELAGKTVHYTAVELHPVPEDVAASLGYTADPRFMAMHRAKWDTATDISESFTLFKIHSDLALTDFSAKFDLVYFDAFAPDTQPELWTADVFGKIYRAMSVGGILVTYSAKGDVKRALRAAGFTVERLSGALGKRHMLRAVKPPRECVGVKN